MSDKAMERAEKAFDEAANNSDGDPIADGLRAAIKAYCEGMPEVRAHKGRNSGDGPSTTRINGCAFHDRDVVPEGWYVLVKKPEQEGGG